MKRMLALLATGAALIAGAVVVPVAVDAAPAQAASSCKQVWTGKYKQLNTVHCWFTPSNPSCIVKVYRTQCGGKF